MSDSQNQGMGCFAKGCLTIFVVGIILVAMIGGGTYYVAKKYLTAEKGVPIRVEQPTDAQMQAAAAKSQALSDAYKSGKEVTVELTGPDLNALIAHNPTLSDYRGTMYFSIANSELSADVSVPLKFLPVFKDRFFNGSFVAFFEWNNGELTFKPKLLRANGNQFPDAFLAQINSADGQRQINDKLKQPDSKEFRELMDRFKSVRVAGDRLVITTKSGPPRTK
jgi:hypothetical protein